MKHTAEELAEIKERKRLKKETKKEKGSVGKIDINPYGVNFFNIWKKFPKKNGHDYYFSRFIQYWCCNILG
ncbi:hypothetical protein [Metamycoplasma hominis]|uniref:hypothetical protein n=1 Tax=Metamycoplasma hominis TaxID=2098 RepID=UPI002410BF5B|nr:hypothetical protein [Metamycoplasma hominis]